MYVERIILANENNEAISKTYTCSPTVLTPSNDSCEFKGYIIVNSVKYSKDMDIKERVKMMITIRDSMKNNMMFTYLIDDSGISVTLENVIYGKISASMLNYIGNSVERQDNLILSKYDESQIAQLHKEHAESYSRISALTIEKEVVENRLKDVEFRYEKIKEKCEMLEESNDKLTKKLNMQISANKKLKAELNKLKAMQQSS